MQSYSHSISAVVIRLGLFLYFLWICGCGNSQDAVFTTGSAVSANQSFRLQIQPGQLSEQTTEIGFIAFDSAGKVVLETYLAPSTSVNLSQVPDEAVEIAVLLQARGRIERVAFFPIDGSQLLAQGAEASPFLRVEEAFADISFRDPRPELEVGAGELAVLKVEGVTAQGRTIDLTDTVHWSTEAPEVAEVLRGVVSARSPGQTKVGARVGGTLLRMNVRVGNQDLPTIESVLQGGTFDLEAGTLDGRPVRGWDPDTKSLTALAFSMTGEYTFINGDTLIVACGAGEVFNTTINGAEGSRAGNLVIGGLELDLDGVRSRGGSSGTTTFPSGDIFALAFELEVNGNIDLRGQDPTGDGDAGRPGRFFAVVQDNLSVNAIINVSASSGAHGVPGSSIALLSKNTIQFTSGGQLIADGAGPNAEGPGGHGGLLALVASTKIDGGGVNNPWSANGGPGIGNPGGQGGEIGLSSREQSGTIVGIQQVSTDGGSSDSSTGGQGGRIRASSPGAAPVVSLVTAAGGSSSTGPGGKGGTIVFSDSGLNVYQVPGGSGQPSGLDGEVSFGENNLLLEDGQHVFDTDAGTLDGVLAVGWNPLALSLDVTSFQIDPGAVLNVQGSNPFVVTVQDETEIGGTLASGGGAIEFTGSDLSLSGLLSANGASAADVAAGNGGDIQLSFDTFTIAGQLESAGGESSNSTSGDGGDITLNAQTTVDVSGSIEAAGSRGFVGAGQGGSITIVSEDLQATGDLLCTGGEGPSGGMGGAVCLTSTSAMSLATINCDGAENTEAPSDGGRVEISSQGDITFNGDVTVNSGNLFTASQAGGNGGTVDVSSGGTVTVLGQILANGVGPGSGGAITLNSVLGVIASLNDVLALPGGTVTITP